MDRFGRKILLMLSCATTSLSIAALGVYFYLGEKLNACSAAGSHDCPTHGGIITPELLHQLRWLPLTSLMVGERLNGMIGLSLNARKCCIIHLV